MLVGRDAELAVLDSLVTQTTAGAGGVVLLAAAGLAHVDAGDLHARTGGNPLFIAESIQLLADGSRPGAPLRSVEEVIRERLAPLPPACRDALEVAAVLGRDFDYPPLAAALRASPAAAVAALDPAVNARLVAPGGLPGRVPTASCTRSSGTRWRTSWPRPGGPTCTPGPSPRCGTPAGGRPRTWPTMPCTGRPGVSDEVAAEAARSAAEAADRLLAWEDAAAWWRRRSP